MPEPRPKSAQRRDDLRQRLIDIAEAEIAQNGLSAIKARDLARQASCAVGAIYTVFSDLNGLIMAVNSRTFQRLGDHVSAATAARTEPPADRLVTMAHAYLGFASENRHLWRALFDLDMTTDMPVPDWYLAELASLFALISAPLREVFPDWSAARIDLMTRALFSSVHGIVLLGLQRRISGVPRAHIEQMIALVLTRVASPGDT